VPLHPVPESTAPESTAPESTAPESTALFPPARRSSRGYDEADVDAFLARLTPALEEAPDAGRLTARQVRAALFRRVPVGRRGYDADAVDTYLDRAAAILAGRETSADADPARLRRALAEFRPRRARFGRGYLPEEVDAFLARLDRSLADGAVVAPDAVAGAAFRVVLGGYDMAGVDDLLDQVEGLLGRP
jgi:DivIVA domain-containing protein